ncbi:MAG: DUF1259 domain-containing protein [Acidobacteria bacterium]|nr:DUF1259 domain-containing protein [Acidobacteriota bacterium]MBS1867087.1 DUF1259 domain-containing protein [Acidobacteriota bacterium]
MIGRLWCLILVCLFVPLAARSQGLNTSTIDHALGRSGQKAGEVYRVGFPRTDLHVTVQGVPVKAGLALGSWAAFSGTDENATVMGDLVLLDSEVNPVMEKLRSAGFEITAVHNHLLGETPHVMYVHYMGHGSAAQIAGSLKAALAASKTPLEKPAAPASEPAAVPEWVKTVNDTIGRQGTFRGGVLSFGLARSEAVTEGRMTLTSPQGVAESINFQEAGAGKVATTGDFVLTADEVNPVISALEEHHISVTALHSHMLTEQPRLFFMHFWAADDTASVAAGIKAALSHIAIK